MRFVLVVCQPVSFDPKALGGHNIEIRLDETNRPCGISSADPGVAFKPRPTRKWKS
jgi:hypothetical protein